MLGPAAGEGRGSVLGLSPVMPGPTGLEGDSAVPRGVWGSPGNSPGPLEQSHKWAPGIVFPVNTARSCMSPRRRFRAPPAPGRVSPLLPTSGLGPAVSQEQPVRSGAAEQALGSQMPVQRCRLGCFPAEMCEK